MKPQDRVRPATYLFYRQRLAHVIRALAGRYLDSLMAADVEECLANASASNFLSLRNDEFLNELPRTNGPSSSIGKS